ncbi:MAG: Hint domain-containing protein [Alphaproteobacteria bacterium]|nr:Hint domain-containing protein [Alphaproteobacteria bacterium]
MDNNNNVAQDRYLTDLNRDGVRETYIHDTAVYYRNTVVTYTDGTTAAIEARIVQTTQGHLFLAPPPATLPADLAALQAKPIQSVTIGPVSNYQTVAFVRDRPNPQFVVCFSAGTGIETPSGQQPAEELEPGDLVVTADRGPQPIRWIGSVKVDLADAPHLRPVRIGAGALGEGVPAQDLTVSPQHRVLVRSRIAQRMFGTNEILVAAKQLLALPGVETVEDLDHVTYVHFMFDRHEIVWSNGAQTESLFTGPEALKSVGAAARDEILSLMPELRDGAPEAAGIAPARPLVPGRLGRKLAQRHLENGRQLVDA